jgi:long-chain fatty acid transport protein
MRIRKIAASLFTLGMAAAPFAQATNGMNMEGYGPVASAMGGASMAYDNGTAAVMNNPATLGLMKEGRRADIALGVLAPEITASMPASGMPAADSEATAFYMPAMGYVQKSGKFTYGAGVFSQGGMGTEYAANSFMASGGVAGGTGDKVRSEVGVGRFILPLAYQMDDKITLGGSLDFVWAGMDLKMALSGSQFTDMIAGFSTNNQFYGSASGSMINAFAGMMGPGPGQVSGVNWARVDFSNSSPWTGQAKGNGFAFKLGGTFKANSQLTLGATYHSKTAIGDLTTTSASMSMNVNVNTMGAMTVPVSGSVAVHDFQWPQTIAFGAAYQASDNLLLVADYKNIGWKEVMKNFRMTFVANSTQANPMAAGLAGTSVDMTLNQNWKDQNVFQIGGAYKTTPELTLRAGVNIANNPVPDAYMNPLFPAIAKNHLTLGAGYAVSNASNVDFAYVYVPKVSATNGQGVTVDFGGYSAQLMFSQLF